MPAPPPHLRRPRRGTLLDDGFSFRMLRGAPTPIFIYTCKKLYYSVIYVGATAAAPAPRAAHPRSRSPAACQGLD